MDTLARATCLWSSVGWAKWETEKSKRGSKLFAFAGFNWYRDSSDWKPFHHDSAAFNPSMAKKQNCHLPVKIISIIDKQTFVQTCADMFMWHLLWEGACFQECLCIFKLARIISQGTVGVSFGASRELAFKHVASGSLLYFPQTNGMLFFFGRDVNIRWQHLGWYIIIWGLRWWFNMRTCLKFFYSGLNRERQFEAHVPLKALCKCTGIDIECVCQWEPGRLAEGETAPEHFIQSSSYCVPSCPVCAGPARYGLPFVMLPLPPWLLPTTAATATASSCCCCCCCYWYCYYYY